VTSRVGFVGLFVGCAVLLGGVYGNVLAQEPFEAALSCVQEHLSIDAREWLEQPGGQFGPEAAVEDWALLVMSEVPPGVRFLLAEASRQQQDQLSNAVRSVDLNQLHDRILEAFQSNASDRMRGKCVQPDDAARVLYGEIVSRLGAEVRNLPDDARGIFERSSPHAKYYGGNLMFMWVALRASGSEIELKRLLDYFAPCPDRGTLFSTLPEKGAAGKGDAGKN
jgi:hypothetical protein